MFDGMYHGNTRVGLGCIRDVIGVLSIDVSGMYAGCIRDAIGIHTIDVSEMYHDCFRDVSWMTHESRRGSLGVYHECIAKMYQ